MSIHTFIAGIEDGVACAAKLAVPEADLVAIINARLRERHELACEVYALCRRNWRAQNWGLASFDFDACPWLTQAARVDLIAQILQAVAADFEVDWPSSLLH